MRKQINIGVNGKAMVDYKLQKVNFNKQLKIVFIKKGQTTCEFPKNIYFGSDFTFTDFKKYIIKVFKFLSLTILGSGSSHQE